MLFQFLASVYLFDKRIPGFKKIIITTNHLNLGVFFLNKKLAHR